MKISNIFCYYYENGFFWFRIFGSGLKIKDIRKHQLLFSERNDYNKSITLGSYRIGILIKKQKLNKHEKRN